MINLSASGIALDTDQFGDGDFYGDGDGDGESTIEKRPPVYHIYDEAPKDYCGSDYGIANGKSRNRPDFD